MKPTATQKRDKILKYVLTLAVFSLGIAIGMAIRHYYHIPLDDAINIVDVATLLVTIFLAVYIPGVFDRHMQVKQDKKVLIEHRLEDLQEFFHRINQMVQRETETSKDVYIINNTLDVALNRFNIIVTLMDYLMLNESFEDELLEIKGLIAEHRELLIDLEPGPQPNKFIYPEEIRDQEEKLYNKIDKATSILIFKINDV